MAPRIPVLVIYQIQFNLIDFKKGGYTDGYHILRVPRQKYRIRNCITTVYNLTEWSLPHSQDVSSVALIDLACDVLVFLI
jgi:hypothetical protein